MKIALKTICISVFAFGAFSAVTAMPAFGDDTAPGIEQAEAVEPDVFVTQLVDKLRVLADGDAEDLNRISELKRVLSEDMATARLQRYLLSREQRKSLSKEQIASYDEVFPNYISSAFAKSIDQLVSRTIKVNDVVERRPGDFIVRSKLYSSDGQERAGLDWRILERKGQKQLVDVMVDGLSFNVERRAQFNAILNTDGFPALIAHMQEIAGATSEAES